MVLGERGGEVRRRDRLARAALRREHGDDPASLARRRRAPAGMADLLQREDDVLGQLRQQQDVRDVRLEGLLEQGGRLERGDEDDRRPRVLADGRELERRQRLAARAVQDDVEVAAGERARTVADLLRPADELHLVVPLQGGAEAFEPLARARDEDAHAIALLLAVVFEVRVAHRALPPRADRVGAGTHPVAEHGVQRLEALRAVGRVGDRAERQRPAHGVLAGELELLRLAVRQRELDGDGAARGRELAGLGLARRAPSARGCRGGRRASRARRRR